MQVSLKDEREIEVVVDVDEEEISDGVSSSCGRGRVAILEGVVALDVNLSESSLTTVWRSGEPGALGATVFFSTILCSSGC